MPFQRLFPAFNFSKAHFCKFTSNQGVTETPGIDGELDSNSKPQLNAWECCRNGQEGRLPVSRNQARQT